MANVKRCVSCRLPRPNRCRRWAERLPSPPEEGYLTTVLGKHQHDVLAGFGAELVWAATSAW